MTKRIVLILLFFAAAGMAVWAAIRFVRPRMHTQGVSELSGAVAESNTDTWDQAVEKVKEVRSEPLGGSGRAETPPELKHYEERHWFLATQVAEIAKYHVHTCQDYM